MVKIIKTGEKPRKERKEDRLKRKYESQKKRIEKLEYDGKMEEFLDSRKCGHDIAKRAQLNQLANARDIPPHNLEQFKTGIATYFKKVDDMTQVHVTKDGMEVEVPQAYPMTLEGLLKHLGISYYWWNKYESGEGMENYHEAAQAARMTIVANVLEGGLTNKFNAKLSVFYLQNISKLREKPEPDAGAGVKTINFITVKDKEELKQIDPEAAEEIYDAEVIEDE